MTRRLIEEWLPIAEIGIESLRERTPMTPFPAPNRLHVWWARRPLVAARAAVMASLLPADADHDQFMHTLGVHGDPVETRKKLAKAKRTGEKLGLNPYGYTRAFSYSPTDTEKKWMANEAKKLGVDAPKVLDPTAGGGSIPFESERLGLRTFANDLNPVAVMLLKATLQLPCLDANRLIDSYRTLSKAFIEKATPYYTGIFPKEPDGVIILGYLWARTIRCPHCGGLIPLSPNWRLAPDGTGIRIVPHVDTRECTFEIVHSLKEQSKETVKGGSAICPYTDCGRVIAGDVVKGIAQKGDMGEQLIAVVYKKRVQTVTKSGKLGREKWERGYRAPRPEDDNMDEIRRRLEEKLPEWEAMDIVPIEEIAEGLKTREPLNYGMAKWTDIFSPRQLYCHGASVEVFRELLDEAQSKPGFGEVQKASFGYLALALDKLRDYNSRMTRWHSNRQVMVNTFDRHDFAFKWSYAEMAPLVVGLGYDWAIEQIGKSLAELVGLLHPEVDVKQLKSSSSGKSAGSLFGDFNSNFVATVEVTNKSADCLDNIEDHSIDAVVMDPPYYDNVMYAELSDFFYVWLKRTAGYVYPELFQMNLTDKVDEAVANPALFKGQKKAKDLAYASYRDRMTSIFVECRRVLTEDGVLTLMFTHKATGAWDALAKGLMDAGFIISASWPVNTEAEGSLHIKDKAAANSTILLVCRPRPERSSSGETYFWEDLEPEVRKEVLDRVKTFREAGISGIDLYLACFGPALEVFSRHWPVRRGQPRPESRRPKSLINYTDDPYAVTPEDVLETARSAVKTWRLRQIAEIGGIARLDSLMEWFVLAWDAFRAPKFPFDEALGLARVCGLDMDSDIIGVVAEKSASDVILWDSSKRSAKSALGPSDGSRSMLDVLHHAANIARTKSLGEAQEFLVKRRMPESDDFRYALAMVLEVLPPSRAFTGTDLPKASESAGDDFEALEKLRGLVCSERVKRPHQLTLWEA